MSDVAAIMAAILMGLTIFAGGVATGVWARGWASVTQDTLRRDLNNEKRENRRCRDRAQEAAQKLRDLAEELDVKRRQVLIMKEVIAGNLPTEFLNRPDVG